jgi:DNA-binding MurR/RpiR family transcriptional regulator
MVAGERVSRAGEEGGSPLARIARMELSAAERRIVEYLLSESDVVLSGISARDLAARTRTSRSSVDRLAKRLGYGGLKALRQALLHESRAITRRGGKGAAGRALEPVLLPSDGMGEIAHKIFHSAAIRAMRLADILSHSPELVRLVEAFERAGTIQVFGAGASAVVALDMHQRLLRLGLPINFAADHHQQIAFASLMQPGDLAIAISYSGRTRPTKQAVGVARERGATVAAVVGLPKTPIGDIADIAVVMPPGVSLFGTDAVMTRILEMMFNEVLFHCLATRNPALRENVGRIERLLSQERE